MTKVGVKLPLDRREVPLARPVARFNYVLRRHRRRLTSGRGTICAIATVGHCTREENLMIEHGFLSKSVQRFGGA